MVKRIIKVFRYDPALAEEGHFDRFDLDVGDESKTTVLDLLFQIQKTRDPSIAFRYACRISMCGSCGMVISGREGLACKTIVADLKGKEITLRPLNYFPIVKDLVVDMAPFFERYKEASLFFEPRDSCRAEGAGARKALEPAIIRPDSRERRDIGLSTECIACGCCVSSCTMVYRHPDYLGPAGLTRAFTLISDSRDGLHEQRLMQVLGSCYHCRLEFNCTEVCPKEISPTRAIRFIRRLAFRTSVRPPGSPDRDGATVARAEADRPEEIEASSRRGFLKIATYGLAAGVAVILGGVLVPAAIGPSMRKHSKRWIRLGRTEDLARGKVTTLNLRYEVTEGFYKSLRAEPVMVHLGLDSEDIVVYNSRCTHLGCTVHWDEGKQLFVCACHGGVFDPRGGVKAGPPPRPLDRYVFKVEDGDLFLETA